MKAIIDCGGPGSRINETNEVIRKGEAADRAGDPTFIEKKPFVAR